MTLHLTLQDVSRATEVIISQLGDDFVYESPIAPGSSGCVYIDPDTGEMSCLVGRVLHRLGVPKEWFTECSVDTLLWNWTHTGSRFGKPVAPLRDVTVEPGVKGYLGNVQTAQDALLAYGVVRRVGQAFLDGFRTAKREVYPSE